MAKDTFGLGPLDTVIADWQQTGLGTPLQNQGRGISADQPRGAAPATPEMPDVTQADTRQPTTYKPTPIGKSGLLPPPSFVPLFESAAIKYNVPVNVLMALAQQESNYDPNIRGHEETKWGRAQGLMQYLPSTARMMGINPFDPEQAVDAAAKQIRQRLDKGYSMDDAVKEHFAGPDRRLWGEKTAAYGTSVLGKARRIGAELYPDGGAAAVDVPAATGPQSVAETDQAAINAGLASPESVAESDQKAINAALEPDTYESRNWFERYVGDRIKGGFKGLQAGMAGGAAGYNAKIVNVIERIDRGEIVPETEDPLGYQHMDAEQRAAAKESMGQAFLKSVGNLATLRKEQQAIPQHPAVAAALQAKTFSEFWDNFKKAPMTLIANVAVESAPAMAPGLVAGGIGGLALRGGTAGFAAGMGAGSYAVDYQSSVLEALQDLGINVTDQASLEKAFKDPAVMEEVRKLAHSHAAVVGTMDAASGGLAGKALVPGKSVAAKAGNLVAQTGAQAGMGMAGEAGGQLAQGKTDLEVGQIMAEGFGELATAPIEVAGAVASRNRAEGAPAATETRGADGVLRVDIANQPEKPTGPLARAMQAGDDAAKARRVVVQTPAGTVSGFIDGFQQDDQGGFVARVLGDDGQVYQFTEADNVTMLPERDAQSLPALPPPTITVDPAGTAMTTDQRQAVTEDREAAAAANAQRRQELGMSPDIDRVVQAHKGRTTLPDALEAGQPVRLVTTDGEIIDGFAARYARTPEGAQIELADQDGNGRVFLEGDVSEVIPQGAQSGNVSDDSAARAETPAAEPGNQPVASEADAAASADGRAVPAEPASGVPESVADADPAADAKPALTKDRGYDGMTVDELLERRKYLSEQAVGNGGWNKLLLGEKRKLDAAIKKLDPSALATAKQKPATPKAERPAAPATPKPTPAPKTEPIVVTSGIKPTPRATDVTTPQGKALLAFEMPDGERVLVRQDQFEEGSLLLPAFDENGNRKVGPRQQVQRKMLRTVRDEGGGETAANQPETVAAPAPAVVAAAAEPRAELLARKRNDRGAQPEAAAASDQDVGAFQDAMSQAGLAISDNRDARSWWTDIGQDGEIEVAMRTADDGSHSYDIRRYENGPTVETVTASSPAEAVAAVERMRNPAAAPAPAKAPTKKLTGKAKAAAERAHIEDHFTPGNVVSSYGGGADRVVSFDWNDGDIKVTVQAVRKEGDQWVPTGETRTHGTRPDRSSKVVEQAPAISDAPAGAKTAPHVEAAAAADYKQPAIAAVSEFVAGEIDKPALIAKLAPLGMTEGQVASVTYRLQDDFSAADIRAVLAAGTADAAPAASRFAGNKIFTADKVEQARARLKTKLSQVNAGIDPEVLVDGMTLAGAYIEAGIRAFPEYAKAMIDDLGDGVKPYLLSFYEGARNYPGLDTAGMSTVDEASAAHAALLTPADAQTEAVGVVEKKPAKRTRKTGAKTDMTLTQDWGVDNIDAYSDEGEQVKAAFMKEARAYLSAVSGILIDNGYTTHTDKKGRPEKPVSTNEGGVAGSGEASLTLAGPDGVGAYVVVGGTSLRGIVPMTPSGVTVMYRAAPNGDKFGVKGQNHWAPVDLSAADLAAMIDKVVRQEAKRNDTQAIARDADAGAGRPSAEGARSNESDRDAAGVPGQPDRGDLAVAERDEGADRQPGGEPAGAVQQRGDVAADAELRVQGRRSGGDPAGDRADRQPASSARNYRIAAGELTRQGSWKATAERNVAAVELVKRLEAEGRVATPEERAELVKFTGWGASEIANGVFPDRYGNYKPGWQELGERLKAALTPEEYEQARRSTQYAHYTSEGVIRSIYDGLARLGFAGGAIVEPGAGVGHFNGLMPAGMAASSNYTGIEYDGLTGAIARQLYPESTIIIGDYTKTALPKDFFDAAIGNPPFSSTTITNDPEYKRHGFMLHDYFFAKTMDRVKPGGVVVFVTSKGTMDKASNKARKYLADRANLLGAVRLPQTAFKDNAGTEVVTDVLFLQKRGPGVEDNGVKWLGTKDVKTSKGEATPVNEYFADHPDMVLGEHALTGSMYRANEYTVTPRPGDIEQQFAAALANLPENVYRPERGSRAERASVMDRDYNPRVRKEGGLYLADDGTLMQVEDGSGVAVETRIGSNGKPITLKPAEKKWLAGYVGVRDALKQAQYDQLTDGDWVSSMAALNAAYDDFVGKHGPILAYSTIERQNPDGTTSESKRFKNKPLFEMDAEGALAYALEHIREDGSIEKSVALRERVLRRAEEPQITTTQDALFVSLDRTGRLDIDDVARLAGTSREDAISALGTSIYEDPSSGWQQADEYLSGDVVQKLKEARAAAEINARYKRNVDALLAVQPRPLGPTDISVRMGANWVPTGDYEAFSSEVMGDTVRVRLNDRTGDWTVERIAGTTASEWGTSKMSPQDIMSAVLNSRQIRVTYRDSEGKTHVDSVETEKANDTARKMREAFSRWIWTDTARADRLTAYYNEHFNNIAPRQYDGSHLTLPGVSLRFNLYPHQKRAIWRNIQDGDTYLAHAVGAGKTFTMIAAGMEQKRLGLIERPWYVVPNHMLAQFSREFLELYPTAHIMVADEQNFHTSNRRRFIAQSALNNPDAVIITASAFERVPMSDEYSAAFIGKQIDEWKSALDDVDTSDRITRKQMERRIEQLERRLEAKQGKEKKDLLMSFEDAGADYLFVDEAHGYRKLDFATNQGNIKGVDPNGSQRALDLFMKVQYLRDKKPGRAVTLASGTPVTNTMGELFTVQRFMDPEQMEADGLDSFDAWSAQYGDTVSALEQNAAGGYEAVTRFARFQNVPELMRRVRSFMDIVTNQNLGTLVKRPDVEGGGRKVVVTPSPDGYREYQKALEARIKAIRARTGPPKPGDDIILNVIADGRFSAIDMRFVDPTMPADPHGKLNMLLDDMIAAYRETAGNEYTDKATGQVDPLKGSSLMMFTDIGLGEQSAKNRGFDMKAWITKRFTDAGIPAEHVAFMRDHKQHAKKERLFADMREGKKRILIGGQDMETGVNVQKRLTHLFHLDSPWFPASVEQREGRIIRQGNQNELVSVRAYATKGSYDSTMWGMNARKARFIEQAMNGDDSVRSLEDVSEASSFEMASALASGDERYMKLAGLRNDVDRLNRLRQGHYDQQNKLRRDKGWAQSHLERMEKLEGEYQEAIGQRVPIVAGEFRAKIGNTEFDSRDEFSKGIFDEFKTLAAMQLDDERAIGEIGGFPITFFGHKGTSYDASLHVMVPGNNEPILEYPINPDLPINGIAARAANQVNGLDRRLAEVRAEATQDRRNIEQYDKRIGAAFPEESELNDKRGQLIELEAELAAEKAADEASPAVETPAEPDAPAEAARYSVAVDGGRLRTSGRGTAELRGQAPMEVRSTDAQRGMEKSALRDAVFGAMLDERAQTFAHPDVGAVTINRKGLTKSRANGSDRAKLLTVPKLGEIIRDGAYLGSRAAEGKSSEIAGYHYLGRRVSVDGVPLTALVTLEEKADGRIDYYNHAILTDIDGAVPAQTGQVDGELASYRRPSFHADTAPTREQAAAGRHTEIRRALNNGVLGGVFERLMGDGRINLHPTEASLPRSVQLRGGAAIQGYTDNAGRIHLVAENLTPQTAPAVLLHEAFHAGAERLVGTPRWQALNQQLQRYYAAAQQRRADGRTQPGDFWDEALRRVETAQREGAMDPARAAEEFGAYAIENYELAPSGIKKWVETLLGMVKDWLSRRFGIQAGSITPAQLRAMAVAALRQVDASENTTNDTFGGMSLNDGPMSIADVLAGIRRVVAAALRQGVHAPEQAVVGAVPGWLATLAQQRAGLDLAGFRHIIDGSAVRHILKRHSNAKVEQSRGQLPVTEKDFELIPAILRSPDMVVLGGTTEQGKPMIGYAKLLDDGKILYLEEARTGRRALAAVSMRKYPAAKDLSDIADTVLSYARSDGGDNRIVILDPAGVNDAKFSLRDKGAALDAATKELDAQEAPAERGDFVGNAIRDMEGARGLYTRFLAHPYQVASLYPEFTPVFQTATSQQQMRNQIIEDFHKDHAFYQDLPQGSKAQVNKVLELGRLTGNAWTAAQVKAGVKNPGYTYTVRMDEQGNPHRVRQTLDAQLSKAGDTIKLSDAEADAYIHMRAMFDRALDKFRDQALEEMGMGHHAGKPEAAKAIMDSIAGQPDNAETRRLKNVAQFISDIEQSKRTGYVPFTRYGDYVVAVKERQADIQYAHDAETDTFLATGVPQQLEQYLDSTGAYYDPAEQAWRLTREQRRDLEDQNEVTVYSEKVETGTRDMFGRNSERNVKARQGAVSQIPSVKKAIDRVNAEKVAGHAGRRIVAFATTKKRPEGGIDLSSLDALAEVAMLDPATWEAVRGQLTKAMQAGGFRKHFFQSSNVAGYSPDFERSMADYVVGLSGYLSRRAHNAQWDKTVGNIKGEKLHRYATKYREYVNQPAEELALLRQTGFFLYLAGNISTAILNATQVPLMTMPFLSMITSHANATAQMTRAYKDALAMFRANRKTGYDLFDFDAAPEDVRADLLRARDEGLLLPLQSLEIMGVAGRRSVEGRKFQKGYDQTVQTLALPFTATERLNRIVTFIAANRLARKPGIQQRIRATFRKNPLAQATIGGKEFSPYSFAEFAVDETQFRMGKGNRPTAMRGVGTAIMQFKSFMLQFLEAMYRNYTQHGKQGKVATVATLGMLIALSGLWGAPGSDDLRKLFEGMYKGITKKDLDIRTALRKWVYETSGQRWLSDLVDAGLPYTTGADMSRRVGMGNLMPDSRNPTGIDWLDSLISFGGVPADLMVGRPIRAAQQLGRGDIGGAATSFLPNFVENARKAANWSTDGVRTQAGRMVLPADQVKPSSVVMKAIGVQPSQVSDVYAYQEAQRRAQAANDELKRQLTSDLVRALGAMTRNRDDSKAGKLQADVQAIYKEIADHNASAAPADRIVISRQTIKTQMQRELGGAPAGFGRERKQARGAAANLREVFGQ